MSSQIEDNYLSKINRNEFVVPAAKEEIREKCKENILMCKKLASKIASKEKVFTPDQELERISFMHQVLDDDYVEMGYTLPPKSDEEYIYSKKRGNK